MLIATRIHKMHVEIRSQKIANEYIFLLFLCFHCQLVALRLVIYTEPHQPDRIAIRQPSKHLSSCFVLVVILPAIIMITFCCTRGVCKIPIGTFIQQKNNQNIVIKQVSRQTASWLNEENVDAQTICVSEQAEYVFHFAHSRTECT